MNHVPLRQAGARRQLLTFQVSDEWYALPVSRVRRVEERPNLTPVPGAPAAIPGIFPSQGELITALDLRTLLGLSPATGDAGGEFAIIARDDGELSAGLLVDWVDEVVSVGEDAIEAATAGPGAQWCKGQVRLRDRLVSLLNLPALFEGIVGG
ncbi:MAG: purine-binding chemotaxis protein CheW [Armatimonadetes bacterium]|nr:purine-binding chemotaxis protein CheW [Armatimonadota bacterium]